MRINPDLTKLGAYGGTGNFSVSSQGNATWVIVATTICCMHEEERILPKYILGRVSVITVISSYLEFKGYSAVHD